MTRICIYTVLGLHGLELLDRNKNLHHCLVIELGGDTESQR
jgi:hypothetical protein